MRIRELALVCLGLLLPAEAATAQERTEPWDQETIDLISSLPVQHRARVKPMQSLAGLNLLMVNGKRKLEIESGEKLKPSDWLLDCLFFPEQAKEYKSFRIENDGVLNAIGVEARKKRDWYTYNELEPAKAKLRAAASRAMEKEPSQQDVVERQLVKLHHDIFGFESLVGFLDPFRREYDVGDSEALAEIFGGEETVGLTQLVSALPQLRELASGVDPDDARDREALNRLLVDLDSILIKASSGPAIFPPHPDADDPREWWTISDLVVASFSTDADFSPQLALMGGWERAVESTGDRDALRGALADLSDELVGQTEGRGEYRHIPLEVKLNGWKPFTNALVFYLLGFVLLASTWLLPKVKLLRAGVWGSVTVATALVIFGIVIRCIIRSRPPVVTLYDTILFITAVIVLVALGMEWMTRQRIGLGVAVVLGVFGMFLAGRYELKEVASAGDTMASVVAVLDTNYYLAIHVTTITIGYAGGLLAAGIAHVWIVGKALRIRAGDHAWYKSISKMIYGVVCFCLLFSIFGTIMGGVWANDSWGRFWGWDPKENGALLICIWQLLTLHARMGGYIKDRGLAVMAIVGGVVVSFSWWGVNLLNVGLHSYGFTSGVATLLGLSWGAELIVLGLSALDHFRGGGVKAA